MISILSKIMSTMKDDFKIIDDREYSSLPVMIDDRTIGNISYDKKEKEWVFVCTHIGYGSINSKRMNFILKKIDELNKEEKHE